MNKKKLKIGFKKEYAVILVMTLFFILINGYHFGIGDHGIIIPFLKMHVDSSLYQNDVLLQHLSESYLTYFFKVLSPIAKFTDINLLFFTLHFFIVYFSFFAVYLISNYFFNNKFVAYLSILFLIIPNPSLGMSILGRFFIESSNLAYPILLFSLYFFLKERYFFSLGLLGIAFNFHGMSSTHLFLIYLLYFLFKFNKINIKKVALSLVTFLIFASPLLIWKFSVKTTSLLYVPQLWFDLLKIVSPHHIFPLSWGLGKWLPFLTYMLLFGIALQYKPEMKKHDKAITFVKSIIVMMIVGFVFIEIIPVSVFLNLQMFRVSLFLTLFAIIYISHYLFVLYKEKKESKIAAAGIFTGLLISNFKIIILFLLFLLSVKIKNKKLSKSIFYLFVLLAFISIVTSLFTIPYLSFIKIGHLASLVLILIMTLFWVFMNFRSNLNQREQIRLFSIFLIIVLLFISVGAISVKNSLYNGFEKGVRVIAITGRIKEPYDPLSPTKLFDVIRNPFEYYNYNIHFPKIPEDNWHDVQIWTKNNVPKDAIILVPPYLTDFRVFSERAIVGQFLDGTYINFDQRYTDVWYNTIRDLCNGLKCSGWSCLDYCKDGYNSLSEEELKEIAGKYNAEYIVVEKPKSLDLNLLYENEKFVIYGV